MPRKTLLFFMLVLGAHRDRYYKYHAYSRVPVCTADRHTGTGSSHETLPDRMSPYHDALVHVAIVVFYTDADDAGVLALLVVNGRQHCGGNGCHGDGTLVDFRVVGAGWRGGQGVD